MKASEALRLISKNYTPGCIKWWSQQPLDRWQKANDDWEACFFKEKGESYNARYANVMLELIEIYKKSGHQPKSFEPIDSFMIANSERTDKAVSKIHQECARCMSSENLKIKRENKSYYFVCKMCEPE